MAWTTPRARAGRSMRRTCIHELPPCLSRRQLRDCMKHALLVWLLRALRRRGGPSGCWTPMPGWALRSVRDAAARTGEATRGICGCWTIHHPRWPPTSGWSAAWVSTRLPWPLRAAAADEDPDGVLRTASRGCCPARRLFAATSRWRCIIATGWEALGALPAPFRREAGAGSDRPAIRGRRRVPAAGHRPGPGPAPDEGRSAGGWYPIKHRAPVRAFHTALQESGLRDLVAAEMFLRAPPTPPGSTAAAWWW